jgi:orotate phosphoribosyltransferase-like protein
MSKLTVSYRNLQSDEKVEIASPAPSRDDQLSWSQEGSNSFAARGSTIVLGMQERQTNVTFIVGVFAGLVPLIVSWVYKQLGQRADPKPKKK